MKDLLLLTHRIPWPPDKGDKIRSFNILRHLARQYNVHLGTFVDNEDDWQYVPELERRCASVCVRPARRWRTISRGCSALLRGKPVTMNYYADAAMGQWIKKISSMRDLAAVLVFSSGMAQHAKQLGRQRRLLDMVDIDSAKWRQYAALKRWPIRWVYSREARLLAIAEAQLVAKFDRTLLVSHQEAAELATSVPEYADRITVMPNGVNAEYFSPERDYENPYPAKTVPIVFTGAMDYWANAEAVEWFASEVLPLVQASIADSCFYIVGSRPTADVLKLARLSGVRVTGQVPDVRPYLAHAAVAVAPLRVARGLQNKILEAMSMGRGVVATPAAAAGIDNPPPGMCIASGAEQFAAAVVSVCEKTQVVLSNREFVTKYFSWTAALRQLDLALNGPHNTTGAEVV